MQNGHTGIALILLGNLMFASVTFGLPDLEPVGVSDAVAYGPNVTFSYSIRNNGDQLVEGDSFYYRVYVSPTNEISGPESINQLFGQYIAPGVTVTVTNTIEIPAWAASNAFLIVVADSWGDAVYELDESNNSKAYPLVCWHSDLDTDGDGFDDAWEILHGWNATVPDTDILPYILSRSATFGIYTTNSLGFLAAGSLLIRVINSNVQLSMQMETASDLTASVWTNAGQSVEWSMPVATNKAFYRVGIRE